MKALVFAAVLAAGAFAADVAPPRNDTPQAKELQSRIDAYLKLRKDAVAKVPKLKDKAEPEEIQAHKAAELLAIRTARANARQGDIIPPEIQQYLRQIIRTEMRGRQGKASKNTVQSGNPVRDTEAPKSPVTLAVNAPYPERAPLSTVPPTLLLRLPTLPKELDFRFVGRDLILHDVQAAMIVDFVPNATP